MKTIKTIESTVTSLVKAFKSVGAEVDVDGSYVSRSQYVTVFSADYEETTYRCSEPVWVKLDLIACSRPLNR